MVDNDDRMYWPTHWLTDRLIDGLTDELIDGGRPTRRQRGALSVVRDFKAASQMENLTSDFQYLALGCFQDEPIEILLMFHNIERLKNGLIEKDWISLALTTRRGDGSFRIYDR